MNEICRTIEKAKIHKDRRLRYSTNNILYAYRILLLRRTSVIALDEDFQSFRVSIHNLIEVSQLLGPDALAVLVVVTKFAAVRLVLNVGLIRERNEQPCADKPRGRATRN